MLQVENEKSNNNAKENSMNGKTDFIVFGAVGNNLVIEMDGSGDFCSRMNGYYEKAASCIKL